MVQQCLVLMLHVDNDLHLLLQSTLIEHKLFRDVLDRCEVMDVLHGDHIDFFLYHLGIVLNLVIHPFRLCFATPDDRCLDF